MATNTQFSIAVHIMIALGFNPERQLTSAQLAKSVNTSPSFVRRVLAKLAVEFPAVKVPLRLSEPAIVSLTRIKITGSFGFTAANPGLKLEN